MHVCSVSQLCPTLCDPMDCNLPSAFVHGIFQARMLEWGCHFLLQGIFPTQGLNPHLLHCQADSLPLSHLGSPTHFHSWSNLMWQETILITHQCHCYQKKNPQKSLFSTLCFSSHYHHRISHVVFRPKSQGWKREMRSPYEFIFPCWILEGSIAELVTNSVGLFPGISVMLQNTPTDFLMKWTCNESHMEKSVMFTACDSVVGWSHTYRGSVPWS